MLNISEFVPEKIKLIVFDVDNTLTRDTTNIKLDVWTRLFSDRLDLLQEARELYEYTGEGDRYNMVAHILREPQDYCRENEVVQVWVEKFGQITQAAIRKKGIHKDDLAMLVRLKGSFPGPIYLLSATPEDSVVGNIEYFENKYSELKGMFSGVVGTPMSAGKAGELKTLAVKHDLDTNEIVMVGDGGSDYSGARGACAQFVSILSKGNLDKWPDKNFPKLESIKDLLPLLKLK